MATDPSNVRPRKLLTPDETAQLLRVSKSSVYRLVERREIPFYRLRGNLRFDQGDIDAYLERCRVGPVA